MKKKRKMNPSLRNWNLDMWANEIWTLYGHHDKRRSIPLMWLSVVEYASKIAEDVRRYAYNDLLDHLAHAFTWIASFIGKCNNDNEISPSFKFIDTFADIVAFKYPRVCGLCENATCTCGLVRDAIESISGKRAEYKGLLDRRKKFHIQNSGYRKKKVDDWVRMFESIYGNIVKGLTLEHIAFHFMEEVGEVSTAIRKLVENEAEFPSEIKKIHSIEKAVEKYTQSNINVALRSAIGLKLMLAIEIADSFSWWSSVYLKVEQILRETKSPLIWGWSTSSILQRKYKIHSGKLLCPDCGKAPCKCKIFISG